MKRKIVCVLLVLLLSVCAMFSCTGNETNGENNQSQANRNFGEIYRPGDTLVIVNGGVSDSMVQDFSMSITYLLGNYPIIKGADTPAEGGQLIIGDNGSELSKKAERILSRLEKEEAEELGYVIYSDGYSVVILFERDSWGVDAAANTVFEYFRKNCIAKDGSITLESGIVTSGVVNYLEYQEAADALKIESEWSRVRGNLLWKLGGDSAATDEIMAALKKLYANYNDGVISWFANLYEPTIGGWYYSNSARNTLGYLPDIESTCQALDFIGGSGLAGDVEGSPASVIPDWMQEQIIYFVKSRQDPNGYFYHPQWTKDAVDSNYTRRGRDLTKGVAILSYFGAKPTYDTPTGTKGDGILADGTPVTQVSSLTSPLKNSIVEAVSKIKVVNSSGYVDPILQSKESFVAYLDTLDINATPYKTSSVLSTWTAQIVTRDRQLKAEGKEGLEEVYFEWLESRQNPKTGLWTKYDYADYEGINGLLKICGTWNAFGRAFPHPIEAAKSTLEVIQNMKPEEVSIVCDVYNTWYAILDMMENVRRFNPSLSSNMNEFYKEILLCAPKAIENTAKCIAAFSKPDGSFSFNQQYSCTTSSGMYVALPNQVEGDINATEIATVGTVSRLFKVLGIGDMVPLYTESDRIRYLSILEELSEAIKDELPEAEPYTYDDDSVGTAPGSHTVLQNSSGTVQVVEDPRGEGNVLEFKSINNGYDYVLIPSVSMIGGASCFVMDSEFCITSSDAGYISQIQLYSEVHMLGVVVMDENNDGRIDKNDGVYLYEESSSTGANSVSLALGRVASVGEWFKIRLEYYVLDAVEKEVRIKIYLNEKLVAVTDNYYDAYGAKVEGNGNPKINFQSVRIIMMSTNNCTMLVDNAVVTQNNNVYKPETNDYLIMNVDAPDKPEKIYDFEEGIDGDIVTSASDATLSEKDGDTSLVVNGANGIESLRIPVTVRTKGSNCNIVQFAMTVAPETSVGATYEIILGDLSKEATAMMSVRLVVTEENGEKYLALYDASTGSTGVLISGFKAPVGTEFALKIQYFKTLGTALIYLDNKLVTTTDIFCTKAKFRTYGHFILTDVTADGITSSITVDDIKAERNIVSYDAATKPQIEEKKYDFESMPGDIVVTGSVSADGALKLNNAGASAKIPVNKRSLVANATLFETLLNLSESEAVNFRINFTDENGNTAIAFDFVKSNSKIEIYEVGAKGRYDAPFATFSVGELTLKVMYSPSNDMLNLYVDGVCIGVSSVTYNVTSTSLGYVAISVNSGSLVLDDLKFESYNMLFTAEDPGTPNPESGKESLNFESSSTGNVAKLFSLDFRSAGAALRVKEMLTSRGYSKVLKYTTSVGGNDSLYIPLLKTVSGANAVAFEADLMTDMAATADAYELYLMAGGQYASRIRMFYSSGNVYLDDNIGGQTLIYGEPVKIGEWFNLRVEYSKTDIDYDFDGYADVLIKVYINGSLLGTGYNAYEPRYAFDAVSNVRIYTHSSTNASIYLDNVKFEQFKMTHDPRPEPLPEPEPLPTPDKPSYEGEYYKEYGGLSYDDEGAGAYYYASHGYLFGTYRNGNASPTGYTLYDKSAPYATDSDRLHLNLVTDPADAANKVLWMHRHNDTDRVDLVFTNKASGKTKGDHLILETDFMLVDTKGIESVVSSTETRDYIMSISLAKCNGSYNAAGGSGDWWSAAEGTLVACIYAEKTDDGFKYYLTSYDPVDTSENGGLIEIYKWSTITLDCADDGKVNMYVDGNLVLTKTFASGGVDLDANFDSFIITPRWGLTGGAGVYFDNTFVGFVQSEVETEDPEPPSTGGDAEGGETTDPENPGVGDGTDTGDGTDNDSGEGTDDENENTGTTDTPNGTNSASNSYLGEYYNEYGGLAYNDAESVRNLAISGLVYGSNRNNMNKHSLAGYALYDYGSFSTTSDRAYFNLVTDPLDVSSSVNKVLKYHKYDSKDTTPLVFTTNQSNMKEGNCFVFETKILISDVAPAALANYAADTYKEAFAIELGKSYTSTNSNGQTVYCTGSGYSDTSARGLITACISIVADETAESGYRFCVAPYQFTNTLDKGGEIEVDKWHTIRIETYDNGVAKYYVDGVYVSSKTVASGGVDIDEYYDSVLVRMRGGLNGGFGAYFDDTFVGIVDKEYILGE